MIGTVLVIIAIAAILGGIVYYMYKLEKERVEGIQQFASRHGLQYQKNDTYNIAHTYKYLNPLRQGENRYAFNVISGNYRNNSILLFDYHYETYTKDKDGHRQTHHHYQNAAIIHLSKQFPELICRPEGLFDKAIQGLGFDDIDLDNHEFSRKFMVKCKSKKFAYDIFHSRMMEYILHLGKISLEIERNALIIHSLNKMTPEFLQAQLDVVVNLKELIPNYVLADSSFPPAPGGPGQAGYTQQPAAQPHYTCSTCSGPLSYIEQYQRWYCYHCQEYA